MPNYTIEMLWTCHVCKQEHNRGLARHCRNCGHPKDEHDEEFFPEDLTKALEGDDALKAAAGPDWKCKYCGSLQGALNKCCTECGVDPKTGAKPWEARVKTVTEDVATGEKRVMGAINVAGQVWTDWLERENARLETAPADTSPPVETSYRENARVAPRTLPKVRIWLPQLPVILGGIGALVVFILVAFLLFRTKIVDAHVSGVKWEHRVLVDRYQVFHRDGFYPEPAAFHVTPTGERIHHYDHVRVGSHKEHYNERVACGQSCSTPSCYTTQRTCTSNRNGTANCTGGDRVCPPPSCVTKYCDEPRTRTVDDYEDQPRYQTYYAWDAWDWGYNRTVRHTGVSLATSWPSDEELKAPLAEGEQERTRREEEYHVSFATKDTTYDYAPRDETEFDTYTPDSAWRLKVGIAHGVEVLPQGQR